MKTIDSRLILIAQVSSGFLSLISVTLTASYVGPVLFALCSLTVLILTVGMMIVDFGACSWAARELVSTSISAGTYRNILRSKSLLNLGFLFAAPIFFHFVSTEHRSIVLLLFYPFLWSRYNFVQQFLIATGKIAVAATLMVAERIFWLLIIPLSSMKINFVVAYILPILVGLLVHNFIGMKFVLAGTHYETSTVHFSQIALFKQSKFFGIISISGVASLLDGFFVAIFSNLNESGNYLLAQRYRNPAAVIFNAVATRIRPLAATKDITLVKKSLRTDAVLLSGGVCLNLIFSILLFFFSPSLLGSKFQGIGLIMFLGTLAAIPFGLVLLSTTILSSLGQERLVSKSNAVFTGVIFAGISISAHFGGSLGAVTCNLCITSTFAVISVGVLHSHLTGGPSKKLL